MKVFLFDIDGTLLKTGGAGLASLKLAFTEIFGLSAPDEIPTSGRTDRGISRTLFQDHDLEDSDENHRAFVDSYLRHLADQLTKLGGFLLPGVPELLERLQGMDDVAVGLLTGNTAVGARLKLEYFDIYHHFAFGGFGDQHPTRNGIAEEALTKAQSHLQRDVSPDQVCVIGDTPLDVRCAQHIKARAIAVATGMASREELAAENPDLLLDDLSDAESLLNLM